MKKKKCCNNCDLIIVRQEEIYDEKTLENIGCDWIEVEKFRCLESYQSTASDIETFGVANAFSQNKFKFEGIMKSRIFWINVRKQEQHSDFNLVEGDYMYYCRSLYKLIGINVIDVVNGCSYIKLIGESVYPREYRTKVLETSKSNTGSPDDINRFMIDLQKKGIVK